MKRVILALVATFGLASVAEANGGIFGFRQRVVVRQPVVRQRVVVRQQFVQPAVQFRSFHSAAVVQSYYAQPIVQQFVAPVYGYGIQQFAAPACGASQFRGGYASPFLQLNFGY